MQILRKHFRVVLDSKLPSRDYLDIVFTKIRENVGLLCKCIIFCPKQRYWQFSEPLPDST